MLCKRKEAQRQSLAMLPLVRDRALVKAADLCQAGVWHRRLSSNINPFEVTHHLLPVLCGHRVVPGVPRAPCFPACMHAASARAGKGLRALESAHEPHESAGGHCITTSYERECIGPDRRSSRARASARWRRTSRRQWRCRALTRPAPPPRKTRGSVLQSLPERPPLTSSTRSGWLA